LLEKQDFVGAFVLTIGSLFVFKVFLILSM